MKCPLCGHGDDMHWSPQEPPLATTACRDCLPRNMYPMKFEDGVHKGMVINGGICCWTADSIRARQ